MTLQRQPSSSHDLDYLIRSIQALKERLAGIEKLKKEELDYLENLVILFKDNEEAKKQVQALHQIISTNAEVSSIESHLKLLLDQNEGEPKQTSKRSWRLSKRRQVPTTGVKELKQALEGYQPLLKRRQVHTTGVIEEIKLLTLKIDEARLIHNDQSSSLHLPLNTQIRAIHTLDTTLTDQLKNLILKSPAGQSLKGDKEIIEKLNQEITDYNDGLAEISRKISEVSVKPLVFEATKTLTTIPQVEAQIETVREDNLLLEQQINELNSLKESLNQHHSTAKLLKERAIHAPQFLPVPLIDEAVKLYFAEKNQQIDKSCESLPKLKKEIASITESIHDLKSPVIDNTDPTLKTEKENLLKAIASMTKVIENTEKNNSAYQKSIAEAQEDLESKVAGEKNMFVQRIFMDHGLAILPLKTIANNEPVMQQLEAKITELQTQKNTNDEWLKTYEDKKKQLENEIKAGALFVDIQKNNHHKSAHLHQHLKDKFEQEVKKSLAKEEINEDQALNIYTETFKHYLILSDILHAVDRYEGYLKKKPGNQAAYSNSQKIDFNLQEPVQLEHKIKVANDLRKSFTKGKTAAEIQEKLTKQYQDENVHRILKAHRSHWGVVLLTHLGHLATMGLVSRLGEKKTFQFWKSHSDVIIKSKLEEKLKELENIQDPKNSSKKTSSL